MKILHVVQGYAPALGGTEWLIQRVSEELVRQYGDEVTVFTANTYSAEAFYAPRLPRLPVGWSELNGVRIRRFPVRSRLSQLLRWPQRLAYRLRLPGNDRLRAGFGGPLIPGLADSIAAHPADVVAASSFPLLHMFAALEGGRRAGRPVVLHGGLHPDDRWGFDRSMIYQAIRAAAAYIANTQYEADYVLERGADPARVTAIGVGVDVERYAGLTQAEARARLGLGGGPLVGFIGQQGRHKGLDTLLRAMRQVWAVLPEAQLLIAGARTLFSDFVDRDLAAWPEAQRQRVKLFYNFKEEDKAALFRALDVFAYPSGYESFGIAYLEAWACGLPVIGCRRGAIPWVIQAGRDGLLVPFQHDRQLADAILLLLANPAWGRLIGQLGYNKVITRYNWPEIARRFRQVYVTAVEARRPGVETGVSEN
ncbi:MAG: glycosyltransferase family 4 protein [Anaerolineales bacterium]|nr:glycosyltransferase family 4 protein [Anaerolineales bacterium]